MPILTFLLILIIFDLLEILLGLILAHFNRTHCSGIRILAMSFFGAALAPYVCTDKMTDLCSKCGNWTCPLFCYKEKAVKK